MPSLSEQLERDGYVFISSFMSTDEVTAMAAEARHLLKTYDYSAVGSAFTTKEQERSKGQDYFLASADKVSVFFEEDAHDSDGKLLVPKENAVNKIAHNLHNLNAACKEFSYSHKIGQLLSSLGYDDPCCVQSMFIYKQPGIGGEVGAHQDGTFLRTEPASVIGLWFAIEDATIENSCLWVVPGSHKKQPISRYFVKTASGQTGFEPATAPEFQKEGAIPIEAKAGDCLILHGSIVHFSQANSSLSSRIAYTLHWVDATAHWSPTNWMDATHFERHTFLPASSSASAASSSS